LTKANLRLTLQIQLYSNNTNLGFLPAIILYIITIQVNRGMFLLDIYYKVYYKYKRQLVGVSN
jgi:hypothetical protein